MMLWRRFGAATAVLVVLAIAGCDGDGGNDNVDIHVDPVPSPIEVIDLGVVTLTATNQDQTFEVTVRGASSLVLVADGNDATDIDIEELTAPDGDLLVTPSRTDANPLTRGVSPQERGGSVATVIVPSTTGTFEEGTYTFSVASFDDAGTRVPATVHLTAIANHRSSPTGGRLRIRPYFVSALGLDKGSAPHSPGFQTVVGELRRAFATIGIDIVLLDGVDLRDHNAAQLSQLDVLDATTEHVVLDGNLNRQSDEMDDLFALTPHVVGDAINVFFVDELVAESGTFAVSGGAPGPSIASGTTQSGVVVSTLRGLDEQSQSDLETLGSSLTRELARYLGAPGTIDPDAFTAEQAFVIWVNPAVNIPGVAEQPAS